MILSSKSQMLLDFFTKNQTLYNIKYTEKTKKIVKKLYNDLQEAQKFLTNLKSKKKSFYTLSIKDIHSSIEITRPNKFNSNSFPNKINEIIDEKTISEVCYNFELFDKKISIYFFLEENAERKFKNLNSKLDLIVLWLYIAQQYAHKNCARILKVYFYFTSAQKQIPTSPLDILNDNNVNTAFTTTCPTDSEIVIFRKEEWFKVFIHETFHNFGLDFSNMNTFNCNKELLSIFPIDSEINLYESYVEFWAEIMNNVFCSYFHCNDQNDFNEFIYNSEIFISYEVSFSFFQMVKVLDYMGLRYIDLYSKNEKSANLRDTLYKEDTSVFSYFVVKTILLNNFQGFLSWCNINNLSLLNFKKTNSNLVEYCKFIKKNYKTRSMIYRIKNAEKLLSSNFTNKYVRNNLRMSICEL
jgi:hypothetical protein